MRVVICSYNYHRKLLIGHVFVNECVCVCVCMCVCVCVFVCVCRLCLPAIFSQHLSSVHAEEARERQSHRDSHTWDDFVIKDHVYSHVIEVERHSLSVSFSYLFYAKNTQSGLQDTRKCVGVCVGVCVCVCVFVVVCVGDLQITDCLSHE